LTPVIRAVDRETAIAAGYRHRPSHADRAPNR
jgi:hypothetical protein